MMRGAAADSSGGNMTMKSPVRRTILAVLLVVIAAMPLTACGTRTASTGEEPVKQDIVMAFVPSRDVNQIQLSADKIAQYLSKETGYNVKSTTVTSYAAVTEGMTSKKVDMGWVGPLDYVIGREQNGSYPITASVRFGQKGYKSFIIVKSDSGINELKDLKGKTFIFGDTLSASSSLYPRYALIKAGLDPDKDLVAQRISNQSAVAIGVYQGQGDAGSIYDDARKNKEVIQKFPDIMEKTKVIYTSDLIPADPQIVRKDLNKTQVEKLKAALLKLSNDPEGKQWLKDLFSIDSLAEANDADYNVLRDVVKTVNPGLLKATPVSR